MIESDRKEEKVGDVVFFGEKFSKIYNKNAKKALADRDWQESVKKSFIH